MTETAGPGVQVAGFVTDNSEGPLVVSTPEGGGEAASGVVELSNTDVGEELVQFLAADQFMANASVFETADDLLVELIQVAANIGDGVLMRLSGRCAESP